MSSRSTFLEGYKIHETAYDETFDIAGTARLHYKNLLERLSKFSSGELHQRQQAADLTFLNQGITFTVYGDEAGTEKTFPFDLLPRIITASEWKYLEAGLSQRIQALNLFLHDIYHEGKIFKDKIIPYAMVAGA